MYLKRKNIFLVLLGLILVSLSVQAQKIRKITVAQDGSGNYKTVQAAFNALPRLNKKFVTIHIKNGVYREKIHLDSGKNNVTVIGEDKFKTILTYNDHTGKISPKGDTINTQTSATFVVKADDFTAENLTIANDAGFTAGQAVGLEIQGDRAIIKNCRIVGNQDILYTNSDKSRQYYKNCYIEGTTDFIFGSSTVWFEQCHIHSKKNSHITAASTPKENAFGYIFNDCVLTGDTMLSKVSLGRPWRPYASVTYIHSYIGPHIFPQGWAAWNKLDTYSLSRYSEFENYGPGAKPAMRVNWSRQLDEQEAKKFTLKNVFGNWNPEKNISLKQH
jgi:pectinesterase